MGLLVLEVFAEDFLEEFSEYHTIPAGSLELGFLELGFSLRNKYKQQTKETLNVESGVLVAKCL